MASAVRAAQASTKLLLVPASAVIAKQGSLAVKQGALLGVTFAV